MRSCHPVTTTHVSVLPTWTPLGHRFLHDLAIGWYMLLIQVLMGLVELLSSRHQEI